MKTLQLNPKNSSTRSVILLILLLSVTTIFSQHKNDSIQYLPQISFKASNGLGPYILGTIQENTFTVSDLPEETSKVILRFIDADSLQIGSSHTETGSSLTTVSWNVQMDSMNLPLSPQFNIELTYKTDSIAKYYIAYTVFPDTIHMSASHGWGPFITNDYPLSDTFWQPVPELYNTFSVSNLPPRTDTIKFEIVNADSTIIDSLYVYANPGQFLDSASFPNVRMDQLPLSARYLRALIWCNGGPKKGIEFHKSLSVIPQNPKLISRSEGITLYDSIGTFIQNQIAGNALLVDSLKYAVITNGPGLPRFSGGMGGYSGPYNLNLIKGEFTIETWLKLDLNSLGYNINQEMVFMMVDSVWVINIWPGQDNKIYFSLYSIESFLYSWEIYHSGISIETFLDTDWHHIAFTLNASPPAEPAFYLDGQLYPVYINQDNYNYVQGSPYMNRFKTKPLILGGALAYLLPSSPDYSFITAMDEVRIWNRALSSEEIKTNYQKTVLQDPSLVGYWNFNDLRNRLGIISDISFNNNTGHLKKGATFIPQYPQIQIAMDTLEVISSNALTDSVVISFVDINNKTFDSDTLTIGNGKFTKVYDISALPYTISHLCISEYYTGVPDTGFITNYNLNGWSPPPIATPQYNWNTIYADTSNPGKLFTPITVSNLPENTQKVKLGLRKEDNYYDTTVYTNNTVPYGYSLTLNGTDNYIETSQQINSPENFTIMFWFKTTTKMGGKIIGFTQNQNGITTDYYDRGIYMETDGSIRFRIDMGGQIRFLYGSSIYNDGEWHHVAVAVDNSNGAGLFVDGCLVDRISTSNTFNYQGYWVIGRSNVTITSPESPIISEYFQGSLSEISIWNSILNYNSINSLRFNSIDTTAQTLHFKLNEGSGTEIHDSQGNNNGELKGTSQKWQLTNAMSFITWNASLINKEPGTYTFFANVYYPGGPDEGAYYPLGNFYLPSIYDPNHFPYQFSMYLTEGLGYFNEGTTLDNCLSFETDYNKNLHYNWKNNFVQYYLYSIEHYVISQDVHNYTTTQTQGDFIFDMGDALPGSFIVIHFGWEMKNGTIVTEDQVISFPVYIKPMIPPEVSGDFGPFTQAIAPNVMKKENTFIITTEVLSDLNKVIGRFYNNKDQEIAAAEAVKINETTWHLTYDMATLAPPVTQLKIEYYLGAGEFLALIQGPFKITIHKTRPDWFDFIPAQDFTDVNETEENVTFNIVTPFVDHNYLDKLNEISIPSWVPFIGSTSSKINTPTATTSLLYEKKSNSLTLSGPPEITHGIYHLGTKDVATLNFSFHNNQYNSYYMDDENNIFASQNFSYGGNLSSRFNEIDDIISVVEDLVDVIEDLDIVEFIIKPDFLLTFTGDFKYSARTHLQVDPLSGRWGSIGNLDVDANPEHTQAYQNSASFQFYSATIGVDFGVEIKIVENLFVGDFDIVIKIGPGFGQSYKTIPNYESKFLKSFIFQTYGKFVVKVLWDWYEKTVWGPQMFYSTNLWGDDMSSAFPPPDKQPSEPENIETNTSWPELITGFIPVSRYSKISLAYPEQTMDLTDDFLLVSWVDKGNTYGERDLMFRYLERENLKFSDKIAIATNNHAISAPTSVIANENTLFFAWTQARYTNQTVLELEPGEVLNNFAQSQDIYYAFYDIEQDTITHLSMIADDLSSITSGRTEGNPEVTALTDSRFLLTWLVVEPENHKSDIWYSVAEKQGNEWVLTEPKLITEIAGVETDMKLASPQEDHAVLVWMNINKNNSPRKKILTSMFDGTEWSQPAELFDHPEHHAVNTLNVNFNSGLGAAVWTSFVTDSLNNHYETLSILPWNPVNNQWNNSLISTIYTDSIYHLSYPEITVSNNGRVAIAVKSEQIITKTENSKISQVDFFMGNINNPLDSWEHYPGNKYICDTTKQISDLALSFNGQDSLMLLSQEFVLQATTARFEPANGIMFGDPYMNLVLRSFKIEDQEVEDINENEYFADIDEIYSNESDVKLYQNFPNPCVNQTTIRFYIPHNTPVKLELFDMNGVITAVLVDQNLVQGIYEINLNTALLKPGNYIYKLTTDDAVRTLKMMVGM